MGVRNPVLYDVDGSMAKAYNNASLSASTFMYYGFNHIIRKHQSNCVNDSSKALAWDYMAYCDGSLAIKRIYFTNMVNNTGSWSFYNKIMYVSPIDN